VNTIVDWLLAIQEIKNVSQDPTCSFVAEFAGLRHMTGRTGRDVGIDGKRMKSIWLDGIRNMTIPEETES